MLKYLQGCLWGTAIGDALGLATENLPPAKLAKFEPQHNFLFSKGLVSDDTEHSLLLAQAILKSQTPDSFTRAFAWYLRLWLLACPPGIGAATLKAIIKLWFGFSPSKAATFSAGNGPAMRTALLGVLFADEPHRLEAYVRAHTQLTHSDPKALTGALLIARAAAYGSSTKRFSPVEALSYLNFEELDSEAKVFLVAIENALERNLTLQEFAISLGLGGGVTGYIHHTVPVCLYAWLKYPNNFEEALRQVIRCGGDTDTTAAIAGALIGATAGIEEIPISLKAGLLDWPWVGLLEELPQKLVSYKAGNQARPRRIIWPLVLLRNLLVLAVSIFWVIRNKFKPA